MRISLFLLCIFCSITTSTLSAQTNRIFVDDLGNSLEIPTRPARIVAIRGEQFTTPLLELGAPVVGSTGVVKAGLNDGQPTIRGAHDLLHATFETTGITFVGHPKQPDLEVIASLTPDLIFLPDFSADLYAQLSEIAPTVVINIWSSTARDRYQRIADAAGRLDAFQRREAVFQFRLEEAKALVQQRFKTPSDITVAIAEVRAKRFRAYKTYGAMSFILNELGFAQPEIISGLSGDRIDLSPELVQKIDADFLISTYAEHYGQPVSTLRDNWDALIPGWDMLLHAPRNNQHILISREPMRALSFQSMEEILAIFVSNIITRQFIPYSE